MNIDLPIRLPDRHMRYTKMLVLGKELRLKSKKGKVNGLKKAVDL